MESTSPLIRQLNKQDAALYQELRLESLLRNPEAFGSTFQNEESQPLSWFEDKIANNVIFGAFIDKRLMGVAGFKASKGPKIGHKGLLWGMYVRAEARKRGLGDLLVNAVINHAKSCVEILQLNVVCTNDAALALYQRCGFISYGVEKKALKHNGLYFDETLMSKNLTESY